MKKTIAILMILVLAGVGLFAAGVDGLSEGNTSTIRLETAVTGRALFGVSESNLAAGKFADWSSFNTAVSDNIVVNIANIDEFLTKQKVGWISGFNNTNTGFSLSATADPLKFGTYEIPLTLYLDDVVADGTTRLSVPGVTLGVRGTLPSVKIQVKGDADAIGLAPVGTYGSIITFTVVAN